MKERRYAMAFVLLMILLIMPACSLAPKPQEQGSIEVAPTAAGQAIAQKASPTAPPPPAQPSPTAVPTTAPTATVMVPTVTATAAGPYQLEVKDRYPLFTQKLVIGASLETQPGKVWIGTLNGTIQEIDSASGAFGRTITVAKDPGPGHAAPIFKMRFEGKYLWAYLGELDMGEHSYMLAVDTNSGEVVRKYDMNTTEWRSEERLGPLDDFGTSPGKVWVDDHIIDTQTLEVIPDIPMPSMARYADGGKGWMWMTGELGGACDDLLLVSTDDPKKEMCPPNWPFMINTKEGISPVNPGSSLALADDRMWIAGSISGVKPTYLLEAYPVDMEQAMQAKGPLASVPLLDSENVVKLMYAGHSLWLVYTIGDYAGYLYQLDPKTGETLNKIDLVGEEGRSISDIPMDIAAEGNNLWVLTARQLIRLKLPQ